MPYAAIGYDCGIVGLALFLALFEAKTAEFRDCCAASFAVKKCLEVPSMKPV
jgi:uncharacterized protein with von Willebrand factor type A (vWA) domain